MKIKLSLVLPVALLNVLAFPFSASAQKVGDNIEGQFRGVASNWNATECVTRRNSDRQKINFAKSEINEKCKNLTRAKFKAKVNKVEGDIIWIEKLEIIND